MKVPLRHRYLFWHNASDSYVAIHLAPGKEREEWYEKHNDGNLENVTGIERHEDKFFCESGGVSEIHCKAKPLRCRYLAWFDHKDDQYYQELYLTYEQQMALFGAFDDPHCPNNVTGEIEHEARFMAIKNAIKEKLK